MRMMRKHENDVKCKMTNIQEGYRIEAKYYLGAAANTDSSHGTHATQPDTTPEDELQRMCTEYLSSITVTQQEANLKIF